MGSLGKVAVIGAGAVGGYYGTRLALAGEEVWFHARSPEVREVLAQRGWQIESADRVETLSPTRFFADPGEPGEVDWVIIANKSTVNEAIPPLLRPLVGSRTRLLILQNGMGNTEWFGRHVPLERIAGGLCFICLNRIAPGVVRCILPGKMEIAQAAGPVDDSLRSMEEALRRAGIAIKSRDSLQEILWRKLCWNIPFNGLSIATGGNTTDRLISSEPMRALIRELLLEIKEAARASAGVDLPQEHLDSQLTITEKMGAYRPSSMVDYLEGRPVEIEPIWGIPLRQGETHGVSMPRLRQLEQLIRFQVEMRDAALGGGDSQG